MTYEWKASGVIEEGSALVVNGSDIWSGKWVSLNADPLSLEHPAYPGQVHTFQLYRFESSGNSFNFAAAELSPNVWGFYARA
jgi:hypothetical protein